MSSLPQAPESLSLMPTESSGATKRSRKPRARRSPKLVEPLLEPSAPVTKPSALVEPDSDKQAVPLWVEPSAITEPPSTASAAPPAKSRAPIPLRLITASSYPTADEAYHIWQHLEPMPWFLDDSLRNPYKFEQIITSLSTTAFLLGGPPAAGIMWAHNIATGAHAGVAIAVWSNEARGRTSELRDALRAVFEAHDLHRVWATIAAPNSRALALARRLGFTIEGHIREGLCYRGEWIDVALLGLLRRELEG